LGNYKSHLTLNHVRSKIVHFAVDSNNCELKAIKLTIKHISFIQNAINISYGLKKDVQKMLCTLNINVAAGPDDKDYGIELLKTTFDVESMQKNLKGNFILREIIKNFIKSMDYDYGFPLKAVS